MTNKSSGLSLKSFRLTKNDLPFLTAAILLFSFSFSFVVGSFFLKPNYSNAATGLELVGGTTMALSSSTSSVSLTVSPTESGTLVSASHNLSATTNIPTGYSLSLSATAMSSALPATSGTIATPTPLTNGTWGYALTNTDATGVTNGFDSSYATPSPSQSSKWANPTTTTTIKNTSQQAKFDPTTVYYGVKASLDTPADTYTSTAQYTALANLGSIPAPVMLSFSPTEGSTLGGTAIEIIGTGFAVNDTSITTRVIIGGVYCQNVSISSNTPSTGQDTIYCTTPPHSDGTADVVVTTWGGTAIKEDGFNYIPPATVSRVSPSIASVTPGADSGPQFTITGSRFTGATSVKIGDNACTNFTVVSDTHIVCTGPNSNLSAGDRQVTVIKGTDIPSNGTVNVSYASTDYPTLQSSTAHNSCTTTASLFRDERDSQLYYVKRMEDNKCWMVDNLKYAGYGTLHTKMGEFLTADGTGSGGTTNFDTAKYVDPGATSYCIGTDNKPTNTATECGYLYNWYAATAGTGTQELIANSSAAGIESQASGSICPGDFRLPSATSGTGGPTTNGNVFTAADFPVLNASMIAGSLSTGDTTNSPASWISSGSWGGTYAGIYGDALDNQGDLGIYWASTTGIEISAGSARSLAVYRSPISVYPGNYYGVALAGFAARCVLEPGVENELPIGSNPDNIISTNPAVMDVYPTTGWEGDVVAITSNALFTNVSSVTIGGTACSSYKVVTTSLIACRLPSKTAGTTNDIVVTNAGTNVTNASTYTHMKITYFDPSSSTVTIGGTLYKYYPNGFTSANCSSMAASNAAIGMESAASIAYFRDTRNKQVYKVKKMVDSKCWMVDNLKYKDAAMTYNNGDHKADGGSGAFNTVDESDTQSTTNSDKKFYNNPMSANYCYGTTDMPVNSLTKCGYLYNWYAATNGTGTYATGSWVQVNDSICPTNFRLPSGASGTGGPTTNGTVYTAADFPVLNASMAAGYLTTGNTTNDASTRAGWQPSGAWGGSFSGTWHIALTSQGGEGFFWSSTGSGATAARYLRLVSSSVIPGSDATFKYHGLAVRCVLP